MHRYLLAGMAALALAGCQSAAEKHAAATGEVDVSNVSVDELSKVMKAARAKTELQPGIWMTQMHVVSADLSAFKGEDRAAQEEAIRRQEHQSTSCRKADELKALDIRNLEQVAGTCSVARYVAKGGKLDANIQCTKDGAGTTVVLASGTMSKTGFDVTISQETGKPGDQGYVAIKLQATGKRTGTCG
jgi:outer membrane murein-binding lipoprotein Lpp